MKLVYALICKGNRTYTKLIDCITAKFFVPLSLVMFFCSLNVVNAQTTIYSQNFTASNGTTSGSNWYLDMTGCSVGGSSYFRVQSNRLEARNTNCNATFYTKPIDISQFSGVSASAAVSEGGSLESSDRFQIFYSIDGSDFQNFATNGNRADDFTSMTSSQTGLSGKFLVIKIVVFNNSGDEYYYIDDLLVRGFPKDNFTLSTNSTNASCSTAGAIDLTVTSGNVSNGSTSPFSTSTGCSITLTGSTSYTLNSGQVGCVTGSFSGSVNLNGGTLINGGSASISSLNFNSGTFVNNGTLSVSTLTTGGNRIFYNYGNISITGTLTIGDAFYNYGTLTAGALTLNTGGELFNTNMIQVNGALTNNSTITNSGSITATGVITNNSGSTFTNNGILTGNAMVQNALFDNHGSVLVSSYTTVNSSGSLTMNSGASLNTATITLNGSIVNTGTACANISVSGNSTINSSGSMSGNVQLCDANGVETNNSSSYSGGAALNCNCSGGGYTYVWSNGATTQDVSGLAAGTYTVTVTGPLGTTATTTATITGSGPSGNPATFGSNVWNVYAWNAGDASGGSGAWSSNYSGYYVINSLNFDTRTGQTYSTAQSWADNLSPSSAAGYIGCTVGNDNHSYAFKRAGFPCGYYQINLPNHDDRVQLYVDGVLEADFSGCCVARTNIWSGFLGASSTLELRIAEGGGGSHGSIELVKQYDVAISTTVPASRCGTGTVVLQATATSGSLVDWYAAPTGGGVLSGGTGTNSFTTPSITATTTFYAQARNASTGCISSTRTAVVATIGGSLSTSISGTQTICAGGSSTFTATGGGTYAWSTGANTAAISVATAGTYTVTVTNGGCTGTASRALTVNAAPTAAISGTQIICAGGTSTFTASGGTSYAWSTGATSAAITISTAGTYTVTVTNANGCTATASRALVVNALPAATVSGTNTICAGSSSTFTASGGGTYSWSTGATTAAINVSTAGTYTVTVTTSGCSATASRSLTVSPLPSATTTSTNVSCGFCTDGSASVTPSGGTSPYTYLWSTGTTTSGISGRGPATYSVTVTDALGCTVSRSVVINLPLQVNIAGASACSAGSGSATASGIGGTAPYTFIWSNGSTTATISSLSSGTYFVTATDAAGVTATQSVVISNTNIVASMSPASASICLGQSVQLTASGADVYTWTPSTGLDNANVSNPIATPTVTTTYSLNVGATSGQLVTNGNFESGNTGFTSAYGAVSAPGNSNKLVPEGLYAVDTNANNYHTNFAGKGRGGSGRFMIINGATLAGQTIWSQTVNITPNTNYNFSTWITSVNATSPAQLRFEINGTLLGPVIAAPSTVGTWVQFNTSWNSGSATSAVISIVNENAAAGGNDYGLDDISFTTVCNVNHGSVTVTVRTPPTANAGADQSICVGSTANLAATGAGSGGTYSWSTGANTAATTATPTVATTYRVTVTNSTGCTATDDVLVTVNNYPTVSLVGANVNCFGASTGAITTTSSGGTAPYTYNWGSGITSQNRTGLAAGTYTVTVNASGCTASQSITITQPASGLSLSSVVTHQTLGTNGAIDLSVTGGTGAYTYVWSNGATTQDISALAPGSFTVTVTDAAGCTATHTAIVNMNQPCTCIATGNWSNASTWSGNCSGGGGKYAGYLDDIVIQGFKVTVDSAHTVKSLVLKESTVDTTRLLFTNTNSLNILDTFSINTTTIGKNVEVDIDGSAEMRINSDFKISHTKGTSVLIRLNSRNGNNAKLLINGNLDMTMATGSGSLLINTYAAYDTIQVNGDVLFKNNNTSSSADMIITAGSSSKFIVAGNIDFRGVRNQNMEIILNSSSVMELAGSVLRQASPSKFGKITINSTSSLVFCGSQQQIWEGTTGNTDNNTYRNVIVRNTSAASPQIMLNGDVTVTGTLVLETGYVSTGSNMLILSNNSASALSGHSANSYVIGTLRRHITSNTASYDFPLGYGGTNQYYWARIKNNLMVGPTYLTATFREIPTAERNTPIMVSDNELTYTELNQTGIWTIDPNTQPLLGSYSIEVGTSNFYGLMDNMFRIIKRPTGSSVQSWSNGGGLLSLLGTVNRLVNTGLTSLSGLTSFSDFGIAQGNGSGLPIDLLSFGAQPDGTRVRLDWTVSMEINNDYFTIERSLDGLKFEPIAVVEGAGNHSVEKKYQTFDEQPHLGLSYYRLKQTDFDGASKTYDMVSVTMTSQAVTKFDIYPNPNKGSFTLQMETPFDQITVTVLNSMGQMVYMNELLGTTGKTKTAINLGDVLATGMYFVKVDSGRDTYIKQMIIE